MNEWLTGFGIALVIAGIIIVWLRQDNLEKRLAKLEKASGEDKLSGYRTPEGLFTRKGKNR